MSIDGACLRAAILALAVAAADADVIYVDSSAQGTADGTSWADAYPDLQLALAAARYGDDIWIVQGTYTPGAPGNRVATFQLKSGVALYGGFAGDETEWTQRDWVAHETILSGDLLRNDGPNFTFYSDNSYHVVTGSDADATAILDGLILRGGNANGASPDNNGAAVYLSGGSPTIVNCTLRECLASAAPALFCEFDSNPLIRDCIFEDNKATSSVGVFYCRYDSSPVFRDCDFVNNIATKSGGVFSVYDASPSFIGCRFIGNQALDGDGGVMLASDNTDRTYHVAFVNCHFIGNSASGDGGVFDLYGWYGSELNLTNCALLGNSAGRWAGILHICSGEYEVVPVITNCTMVGNSAASLAAVLVIEGWGGNTDISNSLIWLNELGGEITDDLGAFYTGFGLEINYSNVQGWPGVIGGEGNIGGDPLMVDPDGADDIFGTEDDNVRLSAASPCTDAGSNARLPADTFDLDGDKNTIEPAPIDLDGLPRVVDDPDVIDTGEGAAPIVDMGAYEFQTEPCDGDANRDHVIDPLDSGYVMARFGCTVGAGEPLCDAADVNGDGVVDPLDSGFVLARLGECQ